MSLSKTTSFTKLEGVQTKYYVVAHGKKYILKINGVR
jgi:hypothetical protein